MTLRELQELVHTLYGRRDAARGLDATINGLDDLVRFMPGLADRELDDRAKAISRVIVEVTSIANQAGIDIDEALRYYVHGCPECGNNPCDCN